MNGVPESNLQSSSEPISSLLSGQSEEGEYDQEQAIESVGNADLEIELEPSEKLLQEEVQPSEREESLEEIEPSEKEEPIVFENATENIVHEIIKRASFDAQRYNTAM